MPHWIFAKDSRGVVHQMGGHFVSEISAQSWIDSHLEGNEDPEIFYSPHYDSARVTQEWKFKRIEKDGLDVGTKRIRHDKQMYRLTEKGEEAFQQAMSRSKVGQFPSTKDQVIVDISYGLSPLRGSLLEAEVGGEKGLVDYLRWLEKFVDEGYIEEV